MVVEAVERIVFFVPVLLAIYFGAMKWKAGDRRRAVVYFAVGIAIQAFLVLDLGGYSFRHLLQ